MLVKNDKDKVKKSNPFLKTTNPPLFAAKRCKGCINYTLQNYIGAPEVPILDLVF